MLTKAICAHGVGIDTARLTGKIVFLWQRRTETHDDLIVDQGLALGEVALADLPQGAEMYARITPNEACAYLIKHGIVVPWASVARAACFRDAKEHRLSQSVWKLDNGRGYMTCHESITIPAATRQEVYYVP